MATFQQPPAAGPANTAPQPVIQPAIQPVNQPVQPPLVQVRLAVWLNDPDGPRTYSVVNDPSVEALPVEALPGSEYAVALSQVAPASVKQPDAVALGLADTGAHFYKP